MHLYVDMKPFVNYIKMMGFKSFLSGNFYNIIVIKYTHTMLCK